VGPYAGIVSPENVVLTTSVDALLMAVLGGAVRLVGGVHRRIYRVRLREYLSTLVPWWQYAAGCRLRADDPVSADGADGHPGAHPSTTAGYGKSEDVKKMAPVTS